MFEPNVENFIGETLDRAKDFDGLRRALQETQEHWAWMNAQGGPGNPGKNFRNVINQMLASVDNAVAAGRTFDSFLEDLKVQCVQLRIIFPNTALAAHIEDIRDKLGDQTAASAYALVAGWTSPGEMNSLPTFRSLLAVALPQFVEPLALADRLSKERQNYRAAVGRLEDAVEAQAEARRAQWDAFGAATAQAVRAYYLQRARRLIGWRARQRRLLDRDRENIQAVERAFREQMGLKAPVEYWTGKATRHGAAERKWLGRLIVYFLVALVLFFGLFATTAWFVTDAERRIDTPVYFVISAGLAALTGIIIWVGRLLTRLYLSEHHLRKDAEERATMTETYLALTENGAAEEIDRQIILTALFRNTTDGIVRDDAAPDIGLSSLITRGLTPRN